MFPVKSWGKRYLATHTVSSGTDPNVYRVARLKIHGGSHLVESSMGAGIAVYGVGRYTSYMFPGGLDLKLLK